MNKKERQQFIAEKLKEEISHLKEAYPKATVNEKCGFFNGPCYEIKGDDEKMIDELNEVVRINRIMDLWDDTDNILLSLDCDCSYSLVSKEFHDALISFRKALVKETLNFEEKCFKLTGLELETERGESIRERIKIEDGLEE